MIRLSPLAKQSVVGIVTLLSVSACEAPRKPQDTGRPHTFSMRAADVLADAPPSAELGQSTAPPPPTRAVQSTTITEGGMPAYQAPKPFGQWFVEDSGMATGNPKQTHDLLTLQGMYNNYLAQYWANQQAALQYMNTINEQRRTDAYVEDVRVRRQQAERDQRQAEAMAKDNKEAPAGSPPAPAKSGGSGFLIAQGLLVTANHLVENAHTIRCFVAGVPVAAEVVAADANNDLALLRLESPAPPSVACFHIRDTVSVRQGEGILAMGYPLTNVLGDDLRVQQGIVAGITGFQGTSSQFQVEMAGNPGSSGSPVVDMYGGVVGVVTSRLGPGVLPETGAVPEGMVFAVKADIIKLLASAAGMADYVLESRNGDQSGSNEAMTREDLIEAFGTSVVRLEVEK